MAKRILIIGSGGRENAIVWKLKQDGHEAEMKTGTHDELLKIARDFDVTIVGPDQYLADGIVDRFQEAGLRVFGPTQRMAQIEASKMFAKKIMAQLEIPTAKFEIFKDLNIAREYIHGQGVPIVIKKSGLALGKGVTVAFTMEEAKLALEAIKDDDVVIEEYLEGMEVSTHAFCDGKTFKMFPTSQDHKQIFDGDKGPNTGGMGTIVPVPDAIASVRDFAPVVEKVVQKLGYKGVLYPGFMLTKDGPRVLEFNARFGDPETQSYMRLLKTDLVEIVEACIDGTLDQIEIEWHAGAAATIVMAAEGYPGTVRKGDQITGIEDAEKIAGVVVFPAGMTNDELRMTNGGRVLGVSATGKDLKEALARAYEGVSKIHFKGMQYRKDIGFRVI